MEQSFFLMRKDTPLTLVTLDEMGQMIDVSPRIQYAEMLPVSYRERPEKLPQWWRERSVPLSQGRIREFLQKQGYSMPTEFLTKNLGLSLTDYYWIKPLDASLTWKSVNLFDNDFRENLLEPGLHEKDYDKVPHYSPNGSLQGQIEKTWAIINGDRYLIKGNRNNLSAESITEVVASKIHELQGYDNYTPYSLIQIRDKDYDFGCASRMFTSLRLEFVSAWAVFSISKCPNNRSPLEHYLQMAGSLGADTELLRRDMEYQIATDYLISEYDRHLNNFGLLRDADTLQPLRMAPIYDSGGAMFVNKELPSREQDILNIKTNGLSERELTLVRRIQDPHIVDLTKLPPASFVREMYGKDSQASTHVINRVAHIYEQKIEAFRQIQLGRDPLAQKYRVSTPIPEAKDRYSKEDVEKLLEEAVKKCDGQGRSDKRASRDNVLDGP